MRLRIDLGYDGAGFHGWARQQGLRTVQGQLETALDTVLRTTGCALTVAGRTDTGVHARGQVAHLDVEPGVLAAAQGRGGEGRGGEGRGGEGRGGEGRGGERHGGEPTPAMLVRRLNGVLDPDVRVRGVEEAAAGFDARFSALWRRYVYRIADRPSAVDPLTRGHVLAHPRRLDERAMHRAAQRLLGEHDFAAFCKRREGATTIRTLLELTWVRRADGVLLATVRADAFCHSMVRALVGCLLAVGEARRDPDWAAGVLAGRVRDPGVTVLPAHGLTLEEVGYPPDAQLAAQAERARVVRTL